LASICSPSWLAKAHPAEKYYLFKPRQKIAIFTIDFTVHCCALRQQLNDIILLLLQIFASWHQKK
jgi:hypothetical protein